MHLPHVHVNRYTQTEGKVSSLKTAVPAAPVGSPSAEKRNGDGRKTRAWLRSVNRVSFTGTRSPSTGLNDFNDTKNFPLETETILSLPSASAPHSVVSPPLKGALRTMSPAGNFLFIRLPSPPLCRTFSPLSTDRQEAFFSLESFKFQ